MDTVFEAFDECLPSKSQARVKGTDSKLDIDTLLSTLTCNLNNIRNLEDVINGSQITLEKDMCLEETRELGNAWSAMDDRENVEFRAALEVTNRLAHDGVRGT